MTTFKIENEKKMDVLSKQRKIIHKYGSNLKLYSMSRKTSQQLLT